ncbi:MAG: ester cyclase [Gordonia paraffinivorans]
MIQRTRELYTFWDTGDTRLLHRADSPWFVDHTLPAGRRQGLAGIEDASRTFRAAVPDLRCTVADVLITGDRVSVRQIYTGHFTGVFHGVRGTGQPVRFSAFDIQQVGASQIVGDWHLEDNQTFAKQIGVAS